jgi:hypothetical protein
MSNQKNVSRFTSPFSIIYTLCILAALAAITLYVWWDPVAWNSGTWVWSRVTLIYIVLILYIRAVDSSKRKVLEIVINAYRETGASRILLHQAFILFFTFVAYLAFEVYPNVVFRPDLLDLNYFLWALLFFNCIWISNKVKLNFLGYQVLGLSMAPVIWIVFVLTFTIISGMFQRWLILLILTFPASVVAGEVIAGATFLCGFILSRTMAKRR